MNTICNPRMLGKRRGRGVFDVPVPVLCICSLRDGKPHLRHHMLRSHERPVSYMCGRTTSQAARQSGGAGSPLVLEKPANPHSEDRAVRPVQGGCEGDLSVSGDRPVLLGI